MNTTRQSALRGRKNELNSHRFINIFMKIKQLTNAFFFTEISGYEDMSVD